MKADPFDGLRVLVVEDNPAVLAQLRINLESKGCAVKTCGSFDAAIDLISLPNNDYDLAIVDMYIPLRADTDADRVMRGEELGYRIREKQPNTKIIGISAHIEREPFTPYSELFSGFIYKGDIPFNRKPVILFETIEGIVLSESRRLPRTFIVHGHDEEILLSVKNFLQNNLGLGVPVVLRERASLGKTIIEKFEEEARNVDIVFVLLTPDDPGFYPSDSDLRRSRQNVVFELGFFFGKLQRRPGKVFLLQKGKMDLPSDISGIVYIDITNGIDAAGEGVRRELRALGWVQ